MPKTKNTMVNLTDNRYRWRKESVPGGTVTVRYCWAWRHGRRGKERCKFDAIWYVYGPRRLYVCGFHLKKYEKHNKAQALKARITGNNLNNYSIYHIQLLKLENQWLRIWQNSFRVA